MALDPKVSADLRGIVRDVLKEVLATRPQTDPVRTETVRIGNDSELQSFVARIVEPKTLEAIRAEKLRFTLGGTVSAVPSSGMLEGVITEQKIERLAGSGTLVLAPGAVLTPLARDKARRLGLKIERRR